MSRYRVVLMAYPPSYRRENGSEIADTANELTGERWSIKQSASLAVGGLRTRTWYATDRSSRKAWESGARVGLFVWLLAVSAYGFAATIFPEVSPYQASTLQRILPLAAILAMMVSTRWWVALLVTAIWAVPLWAYVTSSLILSASFLQRAVPLSVAVGLAWWLALATDGRRAVGPAVGISLIIAATVASPVATSSVGLEWMMVFILAALVVGGLIASLVDPRVAAAGAVYASLFLPLGVLSGWISGRWAFSVVFSIAFALAAATSQVGMRRIARIC
jgi:hypothetical protein